MILLHARDRRTILVYAPWLAMSLANMGGSHPITSVYSVLILTPLFLLALPKYRELPPKLRGTFWAAVAFALVFATLVDLASAYMLAKFSPLVGASRSGGLFLVRSDAWWMRFFPLPFDKGSLIHGTHIDTAYLELQLNMPLLFTAGLAAALARVRRSSPLAPFLAGAAVAFPVLAFFSLSTLPWHFVPKLLQLIQFPYRLISYCNLMLLAILLAALSAGREKLARKPGERTLIALVAVATLMFCGFAIKLVHVGATKTSKVAVGAPSDPSEQEVYKDFAFYAHYTLFGLPELKKAEVAASKWVELPLGGIGPEYGFIKPVSVSVPNGGWVRTSLAAFTWNKLFVDGKEVAPPALLVHGSRYAVKLAPGEHVLSASIVPDPTWLLLRSISFVTLALGTLLCFVSLFRGVSPARS
ncbi:MAG: hypothetical protein HY075_06305 [Deltaproteobacteria bacterium]|nr:hypothetical protein [Deltaproteobacteria bacterium]